MIDFGKAQVWRACKEHGPMGEKVKSFGTDLKYRQCLRCLSWVPAAEETPMPRLNIYTATMRSGEIRTVVAKDEPTARRLASEYATEEGLDLLDTDEEQGRALMSDTVAGVSLYRKAGEQENRTVTTNIETRDRFERLAQQAERQLVRAALQEVADAYSDAGFTVDGQPDYGPALRKLADIFGVALIDADANGPAITALTQADEDRYNQIIASDPATRTDEEEAFIERIGDALVDELEVWD